MRESYQTKEEIDQEDWEEGDSKDSVETQQKPHFEVMEDSVQRRMLAERTEVLIDKVALEDISNLVLLDKSTRPIVTLFSDLWKKKFPDKSPPLINFINVGSETGRKFEEESEQYQSPGYIENKDYDKQLAKMNDSEIIKVVGQEEVDRVKKEYSYLSLAPEGAKTLVLEEYTNTGESMRLAKKILEVTFPNLQLDTFSFSNGDDDGYHGNQPRLFKTKSGSFNPPWRVLNKTDSNYGIAGVVDNDENKLTADAANRLTPEQRKGFIDEYEQNLENSLEERKQGLLKRLANYPDRLKSLKEYEPIPDSNPESKKLALEYIKNGTENIIKKLEILVPQIQPTLEHSSAEENQKLAQNFSSADVELHNFCQTFKYSREAQELADTLTNNREVSAGIQAIFLDFHRMNDDFLHDWTAVTYRDLMDSKEEGLKKVNELRNPTQNIETQAQVNALRKEMHALAEEYWQSKQNKKD